MKTAFTAAAPPLAASFVGLNPAASILRPSICSAGLLTESIATSREPLK
jgi:hypothetical protein